jgi:hypothetical protein
VEIGNPASVMALRRLSIFGPRFNASINTKMGVLIMTPEIVGTDEGIGRDALIKPRSRLTKVLHLNAGKFFGVVR